MRAGIKHVVLLLASAGLLANGSFAQALGHVAVDWRHVPDVPLAERRDYERQVVAVMRELLRTNETVGRIVAHPVAHAPAVSFWTQGTYAMQISLYRPPREFVRGFLLLWLRDAAEAAFSQGDYIWKHDRKPAEKVAVEAIRRWAGIDVEKVDGPWTWAVEYGRWTACHEIVCRSRFQGIPIQSKYVGATIDDRDLRVISFGGNLPPATDLPRELPSLIAREKAEAMADRYRKKHFGNLEDAMAARIQSAELNWVHPNLVFRKQEDGDSHALLSPRFMWNVRYVCNEKISFNTGSFDIWIDAVTGELVGGGF
jgi:hypothetical protein